MLASHTEVSNRTRRVRQRGGTGRGWAMSIASASASGSRRVAGRGPPRTTRPTRPKIPTIGEIVVTAQRREESNLQVGLTLTALSADALAQQRVEQVLDLKGRVPNLDIKEQVPGAMPVITIRGVGLNDFGAANSPSAGVYIDQVYVASIAMMAFDMFDLERIEVLKGPQGTLYGRNSTAGALNIITRKPQQELRCLHDARLRQLRHAGLRERGERAARRHGRAALQRQDHPAGRRLLGEPPAARRDDRRSRPDDGPAAARARAGRQLRSEPESRRHALTLGDGPARVLRHGRSADRRHLRADPRRPHRQHAVHGLPRLHRHRRRSVQGRLGARGRVRHRQHGRDADDERRCSAQRRSPAFPATWISIARSTSTSTRRRRASSTSWRPTTSSSTRRSCGSPRAASGSTGSSARSTRKTKWESSIPGGHEDLFVTRTLVTADQDTKSAAGFAHGEWHLTDSLDLVTGLRYTWEERQYAGGTTDLNPYRLQLPAEPDLHAGLRRARCR